MNFPEDERPLATLAVDGTNLLARAIKAMERHDSALSSGGVPTGALMVFINSLSKVVREEQPERVVVCWDAGHEYRTEVFPAYKANRHQRDPDEQDLRDSHFDLVKRFLSLAGVHHVQVRGVEADDIIAHYWGMHITRIGGVEDIDPAPEKFIILSGDKDFLQLVNSKNTIQIRPGDSLSEYWTNDRVKSEYGCSGGWLPLVMALTGDTVDGIPGVKGIGTKTAVKMLDSVEWDPEKLYELPRLEGQREVIERNMKLINLRTSGITLDHIDVPYPPPFKPVLIGSDSLAQALFEFLERFELRKILERWSAGLLWAPEEPAGARLALS